MIIGLFSFLFLLVSILVIFTFLGNYLLHVFFKVFGIKLSIIVSYLFISNIFMTLSLYLISVVFIAFSSFSPSIHLSRHWSAIFCVKEPVLLFLFTFSLLSMSLISLLFPYTYINSILISFLIHELFLIFKFSFKFY